MKVLKTVIVISMLGLVSTAVAAPKHKNRVTQESNPVTAYTNDDDSPGAFWRQEYNRTLTVTQTHPKDKKRSVFNKDPVTVAKQYEGMHAHKDRSTLRNLMEIDPARIAWCAGFVNAILDKVGVAGTDSLQARSFLNWGTATRSPKEGDVVVFSRGRSREAGHVGFYVGEETVDGVRYILVLGGNQRKAVNVAYYPAQYVLGYRTIG